MKFRFSFATFLLLLLSNSDNTINFVHGEDAEGDAPAEEDVPAADVHVCRAETITTNVIKPIVVPEHKWCDIHGDVTVQGDVVVKPGARISISVPDSGGSPTINGNINCMNCTSVNIDGSWSPVYGLKVNGSIQIKGATRTVDIRQAGIGGQVQITDSNLRRINLSDNWVGSIKVSGCTIGRELNVLCNQIFPIDNTILIKGNNATVMHVDGNYDANTVCEGNSPNIPNCN